MPTEQLHIALPDRYRVLRRVATGGMASVYAACDDLLDREVAIKVLAPALAADEAARARFTREARIAAKVSDHPNVVTIYDIGETGGDPPAAFIVMELLTGGTVHDRLHSGTPIPHAQALDWLRDAASGLDAAHATGMVHRDVKPANLLLDAKDTLKVADFGIARLADDSPLTMTGQVIGTASYFSPEQALGRPATEASDRYALAVVAFELLTGRRPFPAGPPAAQARAHVETEPPNASELAPGLPRAVDAVLARGLAKDPAARPAGAAELVAALEDALGPTASTGVTVPAAAPTRPRTPRPPAAEPRFIRTEAPRRSPAPPSRSGRIAALAAILLLAGAGIAAIVSGGSDDPATRAATGARTATTAPERSRTTQTQPPAAPAAQEPADPVAVQREAHALLEAGDLGGAIALLEPMLEECPVTTTDPCAYGWYDLGVARLAAGDPAGAVEALEIRAQNPDQAETVEATLEEAYDALDDGDDKGNGKAKGHDKKD